MKMTELEEDLTRLLLTLHEGCREQPYQDSEGIWTVGIGHNLEANGLPAGICADAPTGLLAYPACLDFIQARGGLQPHEISALMDLDVQADCSFLWSKTWWAKVGPARRAALNDMAFNLGPSRAAKFVTFYGLCAVYDWAAAAADLMANTGFKPGHPLHLRYDALARVLTSGTLAIGPVTQVDQR